LARQEDVPDIITLLIKQHGNYYANVDLYSADFIRKVIKNGDLYIAVAERADGLIAGMAGANRKTRFAGTLEWTMLTIRPSCRGFDMGRRLLSFLRQTLEPDLYTCIYGHCMSLDTASQGILAGLGLCMTGAVLNCYRVDSHAENFAGLELPAKHSLLVTCLQGSKKNAGALYVPQAHREYIQAVYEALGAAYTFGEEVKPSGAPAVTVTQNEEHRYCEVFAEAAGLDFEKALKDTLEQYGALEQQSFNVFINLNDPAAPWACRVMEDQGFFFAGVHALSGAHEYMIFHYSPALPVPFDRIAVLPGYAGTWAYIRDQYERNA
jgi:GNAT superfamily N-acetyltransferase